MPADGRWDLTRRLKGKRVLTDKTMHWDSVEVTAYCRGYLGIRKLHNVESTAEYMFCIGVTWLITLGGGG